MGRCGCGSDQQCLSTNPGNLASYDETGCLYVAEFLPLFDQANLPAAVDLVTLTEDVWTDAGLSLTIPAAGTYEVTADAFVRLHVNISADGGTAAVRVFTRLWNETDSVVVPNSEVTARSVGSNREGRYQGTSGSTTHAYLITTGPTTLKMQVMRADTTIGGAVGTCINTSNLEVEGTSMRYSRMA